MFSKKEFSKLLGKIKKDVSKLSDKVSEADQKYGVSESLKDGYQQVSTKVSDLDAKYHVSDNFSEGLNKTRDSLSRLGDSYQQSDFKKQYDEVAKTFEQHVTTPVKKKFDEYEIAERWQESKQYVITGYSKVRRELKSYNRTDDPRELLSTTREELLYVNSCILQISRKESEEIASKLGKAVSAKLVGIASVGGLYGLVSTLGTAGTGTAIASLSGAAANSATLAWIGGLFGGGMATGAFVTGGLSLIIGGLTYRAMSSERRSYESLTELEVKIIESNGLVIAAIDELLAESNVKLTNTDARQLLDNVLMPLYEQLETHKAEVALQLDETNKFCLLEHAIPDLKGNVIDGFKHYIGVTPFKTAPIFAVSSVIYTLLNQGKLADTVENNLAVEALKRMNSDWADYSHDELGEALSEYSAESLKGVANNAKGIYHELLFVHEFNQKNDQLQARVFEQTNHPGADIQIINIETNEIVQEAQLKALQDSTGIYQHFDKYPDIDVIATSEIADKFASVQSSGISNEHITDAMNTVITDLSKDDTLGLVGDTAAAALLISAGKEAIDILRGAKNLDNAGKETVTNVSVAAGSTLLASFFLS